MADSNSTIFILFFYVLVIFILNNIFFVIAATKDDTSCNEDLSVFLPVPYSNSSGLRCYRVWNSFILRFSQTDENVVTIILSAEYTNGWVGMGFSEDGTMVGSSAMVGWIRKTGRASIRQYYLRGYSTSQVIIDKGELQLTNIPPAVVHYGANIYLAYQLRIEDRLSEQNILLGFGFATPVHGKMPKHDDRTTIRFDFSQGYQADAIHQNTSVSKPQNIDNMKKSHGAVAVIGWGVILPAGTIVARYCRNWVLKWYYLHILLQFVGFLLGLAAVVSGKVLYDRVHATFAAHRGIGIFVFVLTVLQVLAFFVKPDMDSKIRRYWNWFHHWAGRLVLLMSTVNIIIGSCGEDKNCSFARVSLPVLIITYVTCAILETLSCIGAHRSKQDDPSIEVNQIG